MEEKGHVYNEDDDEQRNQYMLLSSGCIAGCMFAAFRSDHVCIVSRVEQAGGSSGRGFGRSGTPAMDPSSRPSTASLCTLLRCTQHCHPLSVSPVPPPTTQPPSPIPFFVQSPRRSLLSPPSTLFDCVALLHTHFFSPTTLSNALSCYFLPRRLHHHRLLVLLVQLLSLYRPDDMIAPRCPQLDNQLYRCRRRCRCRCRCQSPRPGFC
ncbi:uncharacterized protein J3D65DRAFT_370841 [Phyllosticta citribraziliensis]|uniref:Uncharacterized protein n=1 Tax=Phyllosticta citribraziliensis TaxID=989973 RepID=A0ABR1LPT7_9PEZI